MKSKVELLNLLDQNLNPFLEIQDQQSKKNSHNNNNKNMNMNNNEKDSQIMKNIKSQSMFSPMSTIRHNDANEEEEEEIDQFNKEMQSSKDESSHENDNERRSQPNNEMHKHKKTEHLYCEQGENSFKKKL